MADAIGVVLGRVAATPLEYKATIKWIRSGRRGEISFDDACFWLRLCPDQTSATNKGNRENSQFQAHPTIRHQELLRASDHLVVASECHERFTGERQTFDNHNDLGSSLCILRQLAQR